MPREMNWGSRTAFGSITNMNSLANDTSEPLGEVNNSTDEWLDFSFFLEIALNTTGVSATGTIEVYLLEGQDTGADETTDGIDMNATTDQDANIRNAKLIAVLAANANSAVIRWGARLSDYIGNCPRYWTLLVRNMSGAAFAASGHEGYYQGSDETLTA